MSRRPTSASRNCECLQGRAPDPRCCLRVRDLPVSELARSAPLGTRFWALLIASLACATINRFSISISAGDLDLWLGLLLSSVWAIMLVMAVRTVSVAGILASGRFASRLLDSVQPVFVVSGVSAHSSCLSVDSLRSGNATNQGLRKPLLRVSLAHREEPSNTTDFA